MRVIKTTNELKDFSAALRERPFFAVDTEFMREKTYWPILCLVQAAAPAGDNGEEPVEAIIDPMADGIDLAPFLDALADKNVTKVLHAARQDLEIFYRFMDEVPAPLFDTQIAAMACGYGDQIGYEPLMRDLLNAKIDKGSRFTDWARRPLTDAQLSYALSDVTHLRDAYPVLLQRLDRHNRISWVREETASLDDPDLYFVKPANAWKRIKFRGLRTAEIGPLMKLAEWREREAQERDQPRGRILKDDALVELARLRPKSPAELGKARSISGGFERSRAGAAIVEAVREGMAIGKDDLPTVADKNNRTPAPADVVELLKVLLKAQCEHYGVAPKMIASASDLEEIALRKDPDVRAMRGWRREVFGELAMKLKSGDLALKLSGKRVEIVET
ncbi:MAG: ribonuclease D [Pseudomonadota bacterium]